MSVWLLLFVSGCLSLRAQSQRFPVDVLISSPAETKTDLQVICLFRSNPANLLNGSLTEIDQKLGGVITRIRDNSLFAGELGETLLITPPDAAIPAKRLLIVGLGDRPSFSSDRMELVGSIVFRESERLGVGHPFFAPTVLDGGFKNADTGDVAEHFLRGFLRAKATEDVLQAAGVFAGSSPTSLTFLAGTAHAERTRSGLTRAFPKPSQ